MRIVIKIKFLLFIEFKETFKKDKESAKSIDLENLIIKLFRTVIEIMKLIHRLMILTMKIIKNPYSNKS